MYVSSFESQNYYVVEVKRCEAFYLCLCLADMLYQGISEVLKSIMFLIETEIYPGTIKDVDFRLIGSFLTNIQCTLLERD